METKYVYGQNPISPHRPLYTTADRDTQMPLAQEFLLACYDGTSNLHSYWADIVKSYALRDMSNLSDRLTALSGLAAKYLSASSVDEYLAGLWANNLAEGLAWRVTQAIETKSNGHGPMNASPSWPTWSWAVLPLRTAIETNVKSETSSFFQRVQDDRSKIAGARHSTEDAIKRGEHITEICVAGRIRPLWNPSSRYSNWSTVSRMVSGEEKFSFATDPEQNIHAIERDSGRVLVYEDRKREVVGQLDFRRDVDRVQSNQVNLWALELGSSTMLLLKHYGGGIWHRVGVAWDVREDYFASAQRQTLYLR
jgi:hypothetical protein